MKNNKDNDLIKIFNLKNTLEIKDEEQLKRIRKKMDLLINSKKLNFLSMDENINKGNEISNIKLKNISNSIKNEIYYREVVMKNAVLVFISVGAYLYFDKFTNFLNKANSIYYYKKAFLFTFCFVPIFLNYSFSKMNYEYKLLEIRLGKDVNSKSGSNSNISYY